jgi:hypothetical protein
MNAKRKRNLGRDDVLFTYFFLLLCSIQQGFLEFVIIVLACPALLGAYYSLIPGAQWQ